MNRPSRLPSDWGDIRRLDASPCLEHFSAVWQEFGLLDQPGRNWKLLVETRF